MAIVPETAFPGKIATSSAAYPLGKARDVTTPGDGTGTPWKALLLNDIFGFQQALLDAVGAVASGSPDEVGASQYLEALKGLTSAPVNDILAMVSIPSSERVSASVFGFFFTAPRS